MKTRKSLLLTFGIAFAVQAQSSFLDASEPPQSLLGYSSTGTAVELQWEKKFQQIPDRSRLRETMRRMTARPHHLGSPYDKDNAEWLLAQLKSYGLNAEIEQFDTLFPTPRHRLLALEGPKPYVAKLEEEPLKIDPTSDQKKEQLPTYTAFSSDGDVTAPLVYVNYGAPSDYEELERRGISVKGAIVIVRYGLTWRGVKPKVAAEHGAVGCLIYSDPWDDGYFRDGSYPNGPTRPASGVQRGSVMDIPMYPGNPQTPGIGAVPGVKKIPLNQLQTITKIPVMPISYEDAKPLLEALGGQVVPEKWRGALPITYRTGPSVAKVHLSLQFNWDRKPLYNVIARIPGSTVPEQWVIRGNHHDAWVNGAADPISGVSPELEEARALGELLKQGWKPQRTLLYCFWDGEEPGFLGSTEWAETHADELNKHAVAYINSDGSLRGYLSALGSHSLENLVNEVAKDVEDPETRMSLWKRSRLVERSKGPGGKTRADFRIQALGSGSDFTVFLDHLGIPSLNLAFGGEDEFTGTYHSIYDDFYWYTTFQDTDFAYGRALAQTAGVMMLRMADADIIPYQFGDQAETVSGYVAEVKKLAMETREKVKDRNEQIEEGVYKALADPRKTIIPPAIESLPPYFNWAPLDQASDDLVSAAAAYDKALAASHGVFPNGVNEQLIQTERAVLDPAGLPHRDWYKNLIYAPGFYTGYAVKTLPLVREAIEQKQWSEVDEGIKSTALALERETDYLKKATQLLIVTPA